MSRIFQVFTDASQANRMAFMPFITAGDPSTETTAAVLKGLRDANVDLIELGFPYSDPIADGPVIQASYTRALNAGITIEAIFRHDAVSEEREPSAGVGHGFVCDYLSSRGLKIRPTRSRCRVQWVDYSRFAG